MLRFVHKDEYWKAEDEGVLSKIRFDPEYWHIKQIQDAMILSVLGDISGASITEVGGGASRTLPELAKSNTCNNVDEMKGEDGGPIQGIDDANVNHIFAKVGATQGLIADNSQDVVYSISVVEHIPMSALPGFYQDIGRMLKPGGQMIHLIDCYLRAPGEDNSYEIARRAAYLQGFKDSGLNPLDKSAIISEGEVGFHPSLTSNPDRIMNMWNQDNPKLRPEREVSQGCTWIQRAIKPA